MLITALSYCNCIVQHKPNNEDNSSSIVFCSWPLILLDLLLWPLLLSGELRYVSQNQEHHDPTAPAAPMAKWSWPPLPGAPPWCWPWSHYDHGITVNTCCDHLPPPVCFEAMHNLGSVHKQYFSLFTVAPHRKTQQTKNTTGKKENPVISCGKRWWCLKTSCWITDNEDQGASSTSLWSSEYQSPCPLGAATAEAVNTIIVGK